MPRGDRALGGDTLLGTRQVVSPWPAVSHWACCDATGGVVSGGDTLEGVSITLCCPSVPLQRGGPVPLHVPAVSRRRDLWGCAAPLS